MSSKHSVELGGWNVGFQTIDMMKLIRERTGMQLGDAMALVNRVVEGGVETVTFSSQEDAHAFVRDATRIGAIARLRTPDD